MVNVYTVLNVSFSHTKEHVYKLKKSLEKNSTIEFDFFCLTNEQMPGIETIPIQEVGRWAKIELCRPDIIGKVLYLDIDTVLIGNIDFLLTEKKSFMSKGIHSKRRSQIFSLREHERKEVWDFWKSKTESIKRNFNGEGAVYDFIVNQTTKTIQELHPGKVIDFSEASEFIPVGSKIVTFSNNSNPKNIEDNNFIKKYW